jgi:hypothetical protein
MEVDNDDDNDATTSRPSKKVKTDAMYDDDFELTKENIKQKIRRLEDNEMELLKFQNYLQEQRTLLKNKQTLSLEERETMIEILANGEGRIEEVLEALQQKKTASTANVSDRVTTVTDGLDERLKHNIDVIAFKERVMQLFDWYDKEEYKEYIGPYFPMIQSSGMGKTRLFMELKKLSLGTDHNQVKCITLICKSNDPNFDPNFFDGFIDTGSTKDEELRQSIVAQLENVLSDTSSPSRIVLLFDEAQHLLGNDGFAFRCVRWWLRRKHEGLHIVAVFAGTTSRLANFFGKDPSPSKDSRNPKAIYWNMDNTLSRVYPPFFRICTIGCYHADMPDEEAEITELEKAAFYGRPLFAYLQKNKTLLNGEKINKLNVVVNTKLYNILKRMLLSNDDNKWSTDDRAVYSILGTCVQMGITTSFHLASDLVSHAYANLVSFEQYQANDNAGIVVRTTFMPDPVCAALAMGLMVPEWKLMNINKFEFYNGKDRKFWSRKAMECFANGLCVPEKGDLGEIMVALYMLFCGDMLRMKGSKTLQTFSISLKEWCTLMKQPHLDVNNLKCDADPTPKMEVSFIQVCRNYFRDYGWNSSRLLKWMYNAAVGTYVFPQCPAIDIVSAIRVTSSNRQVSYHPLLVSVKCKNMKNAEIIASIDKIKKFLGVVRKKQPNQLNALCLLIVIGKTPLNKAYDEGDFPHEDAYRLIAIPEDDPFDITENVYRTTEVQEMAEIYTSYPFLYTTQPDKIIKDDVECQDATEMTMDALFEAMVPGQDNAILRKSASSVAKQYTEKLVCAFAAVKDNPL